MVTSHVTMVTITCYHGYHHMLPWLQSHVTMVTSHVTMVTSHVNMVTSHVTMVTITCYHGYHHMLPWLPSHVTMVTITCYHGYYHMLTPLDLEEDWSDVSEKDVTVISNHIIELLVSLSTPINGEQETTPYIKLNQVPIPYIKLSQVPIPS